MPCSIVSIKLNNLCDSGLFCTNGMRKCMHTLASKYASSINYEIYHFGVTFRRAQCKIFCHCLPLNTETAVTILQKKIIICNQLTHTNNTGNINKLLHKPLKEINNKKREKKIIRHKKIYFLEQHMHRQGKNNICWDIPKII